MKNEKILTIIKGQEFKLSLKDKIEINDIFYDQYLGTNLQNGLQRMLEQLKASDPDREKYILVISDGEPQNYMENDDMNGTATNGRRKYTSGVSGCYKKRTGI